MATDLKIKSLIKQLREYATDPGFSHGDYADSMRMAAKAIERLLVGSIGPVMYKEKPILATFDKETWVPVAGFEHYKVSSDGNLMNQYGKLLGLSRNGGGYVQISLSKHGKRKQELMHRLVAKAFLGDFPDLEVNHKNGIKDDNRVANLEWVTKTENEMHARYVLRNQIKPITRTSMKGELKHYDSIELAARDGFIASCIYHCCHGKRLSHRGFFWDFTENIEVTPVAPPSTNAKDSEDAARYRWLKSKARVEDRDGGCNGFYRFPFVDKYNLSTWRGAKPYDYKTVDKAVDKAMDIDKKESP